jgi:signal recognition particle receptor subunit beta
MVQINFARKEINCKIVYYGPGLGGKTTNLEQVHARAPQGNKGDLTSISTDGDRTLFFDFMPLDLGTIAGMRTKFHIYTVPGQVYYNSTRKLVLLGADGIIFVADSSPSAAEANKQSLENLKQNLAEMGKDIAKMPLVIQYNKRDMQDAMDVAQMDSDLNLYGVPTIEAVACKGEGVFQTLKAISSLVLESINSNERQGTIDGSSAAAAPAAQQAAPAQAPPTVEAPAPAPTPAPVSETPVLQPAAAAVPDRPTGPAPGLEIERNYVPQPDGATPTPMPQDEHLVAAAQNQGTAGGEPPAAPATPAGPATTVGPAAGVTPTPTQPGSGLTSPTPGRQTATLDPPKLKPAAQSTVLSPKRQAAAPRPVKEGSIPREPRDRGPMETKPKPTLPKREIQVIGGKPKGRKKKNNAMGIVIVVVVTILLIGAGVAYFLMM